MASPGPVANRDDVRAPPATHSTYRAIEEEARGGSTRHPRIRARFVADRRLDKVLEGLREGQERATMRLGPPTAALPSSVHGLRAGARVERGPITAHWATTLRPVAGDSCRLKMYASVGCPVTQYGCRASGSVIRSGRTCCRPVAGAQTSKVMPRKQPVASRPHRKSAQLHKSETTSKVSPEWAVSRWIRRSPKIVAGVQKPPGLAALSTSSARHAAAWPSILPVEP